MKLLALPLVIGLVAACTPDAKDTPTCKQLREHIFRITPQSQQRLAGRSEAEQRKILDQLMATVPVEDVQQCTAADAAVIACMLKATDMPALRACIPPPKSG